VRTLARLPYEAAWLLANGAARVVPDSSGKIARSLRARLGLLDRYRAWADAHRDPSRPLLWMHASSVGESLQALPILEMFRDRRPDVQLVFTFFSPSAEQIAKTFPADFSDFLPFDTSANARHLIDALKPSAIVFSKVDVWPLLVHHATHAGVKTGLVSATLGGMSQRKSGIASLFLRDAYAALDSVGAISSADMANLVKLGVRSEKIKVTGDTRYDQVWARRNHRGSRELVAQLASGRLTIVAGSTWPSDEARLFPAFAAAHENKPDTRMLIAPHEPDAMSVGRITTWCEKNRLRVTRLSDAAAPLADVVIIDRTGILGDLYALADIAYVGGGFHRAGLHSVLEPAAFGKPVLFGASFGNTRDAQLLTAAGAAVPVRNAGEMTKSLVKWLTDSTARQQAGAAAEGVVRSGLGAAERSFQIISGLVSSGSGDISR
jgi:3-deoxy-D-manno-octulosonic-acid transferase